MTNNTTPKFFYTSDYPDGLTVYVNGSVVYSFYPGDKPADCAAGRNDGLVTDVMPGQGE